MKYLCLCYYDRAKFEALSQDDLEAVGRICRPHNEALRQSGHLLLVGSLALPDASRTLRAGSGGALATDGPYARTREPVGAFFTIEAAGMDEAVEIASKHPRAHVGEYFGAGIEVRPIDLFDQPELRS